MVAECMSGSGPYPTDCELTEALRERARTRNQRPERSGAWQVALTKAAQVRLLLLDVDGVLTDGSLLYTESGGEIKSFNTQDGLGLTLLANSGLQTGLITARHSPMVERRAQDLKMHWVLQGRRDKLAALEEVLAGSGLRPPQLAYIGDDWLDLPILKRVGLSAAPANAVIEVQQRVDYVCQRAGGRGAVRELCDLILEAQGNYASQLARFDR
jgi:3-deoxy-D-manno-octulosonate 8-phosphate phosphatase (KDO 8-P phosphatase)